MPSYLCPSFVIISGQTVIVLVRDLSIASSIAVDQRITLLRLISAYLLSGRYAENAAKSNIVYDFADLNP